MNEVIQLLSVLLEITETNPLPLDSFMAKSCANAVQKLVENVAARINEDKTYKEKPQRCVATLR